MMDKEARRESRAIKIEMKRQSKLTSEQKAAEEEAKKNKDKEETIKIKS